MNVYWEIYEYMNVYLEALIIFMLKIMMLLVKNALWLSLPQSSVNVCDKTRVAKQCIRRQFTCHLMRSHIARGRQRDR